MTGKAASAALCSCVVLFGAECTFQINPEAFLMRQTLTRRSLQNDLALGIGFPKKPGGRVQAAAEIPRRNFIDEEIFGKMERQKVTPAPLSSDEEFLRRVYLDATGLIPTPDEVRAFMADASEDKRDKVLDKLLYSRSFTDKWTMWMGDLLQNVVYPANFDRQYDGRNAYFAWIRLAVANAKSLKDIAYESVTGTGNSYDFDTGNANFPLNGITPMGPTQDTYDTMLNKTATTFLGLSHYDCLLCHNGRGHLEGVSLWGANNTRAEAQRMAAFFARLRMSKPSVPASNFYYNSYNVTDATGGTYDLNTNYGNRPDRLPIGGVRNLTPEYRVTGAAPETGNWRVAFAENMVRDPMFTRNFANRIWKELFRLPLADPVDGLDPARLDPANPPPAPWTFQATHPELLEKLAAYLVQSDFSLRELMRFIMQSSAYQLSSRYEGTWKYEYISLFARHFPRRLEGEEVHDAIVKGTGAAAEYTIRGLDNVTVAMQLPDPVEPRSNGAVANFINFFLRGNRDTQDRSQNGSILQQLGLMNDAFVLNRTRLTASPKLAAAAKLGSPEAIVEEIFLLLLSRRPTAYELTTAVQFLAEAKTDSDRNAYIEDLAWACINKLDFLFSY